MTTDPKVVSTFASAEDFDGLKGTPWEELAHLIPRNSSVPEMLRAAKLDWKVLHLPTFTEIHDEQYGKRRFLLPKTFCLLREDNHEILSPYMGNRYKPVQNSYAFEVFDQFVKAGDMRMETAGSLRGGKHIWGLAAINDEFILGDGEVIRGYFLLMQSHAYGFALKAMFTPIRYPAGHSFIMPLKGVKGGFYTMPHSRVFDDTRIEDIKGLVTKAEAQFSDFEGKARFLADSSIEEKDGVLVLARLFDQKLINRRSSTKDALPQSYEEALEDGGVSRSMKNAINTVQSFPGNNMDSCNGTAWGLFQGIVHEVDHRAGRGPDTRMEASWMGRNVGFKTQALDLSLVAASKAK